MKDASGSMRIVLEGKYSEGSDLVAIGWGWNSKVALCFAMTMNKGSMRKWKLHKMKFVDSHSNAYVRLVCWLLAVLKLFEMSNAVDKHDQACQYELILEKK